jgi:hypothetical protein
MKPVLALAATLMIAGCMDHFGHVETTPVSNEVRSGPPIASSLRAYVLLRDTNPGLIAEARASLSCSVTLVEVSRQVEIIDIKANSARWVGAVALFGAAGLIAISSKESKEEAGLLTVLVAGGTAVVVAPALAERRKRTFIGYVTKDSAGPAYRCQDHGVGEVRLTLRDENGTHEAITDEWGRAQFPSANAWSVRIAYIDDRPVPAVLVGSDRDSDAE